MDGDFVQIGVFDGEPVKYSVATDILNCKDVNVYYRHIKRFEDSGLMMTQLNVSTKIAKTMNTVTIGCLTDSIKVYKQFFNKIEQLKIRSNGRIS